MKGRSATEVVGRNVRHIREDLRGAPLRTLADQLNWSRSTLSELERGKRRCTVDDLLSIAAALSVAPAALLSPWDDVDHEDQLRVELPGAGAAWVLDTATAWGWIVGAPPADTMTFGLFHPREYFTTTPAPVQAQLFRGWTAAAEVLSKPGGFLTGVPTEQGFIDPVAEDLDALPAGDDGTIRLVDGFPTQVWHHGRWVDVDELDDDHPAHANIARWYRKQAERS